MGNPRGGITALLGGTTAVARRPCAVLTQRTTGRLGGGALNARLRQLVVHLRAESVRGVNALLAVAPGAKAARRCRALCIWMEPACPVQLRRERAAPSGSGLPPHLRNGYAVLDDDDAWLEFARCVRTQRPWGDLRVDDRTAEWLRTPGRRSGVAGAGVRGLRDGGGVRHAVQPAGWTGTGLRARATCGSARQLLSQAVPRVRRGGDHSGARAGAGIAGLYGEPDAGRHRKR